MLWRAILPQLLAIGLLVTAFCATAQPAYIYEGRTWDPNHIIGNVWNGVLIEGQGQDLSYAIVRTDGQHIYMGNSTSHFDLLYTLRDDNKLYNGDSRFLSDVVCTIRGPHIYLGDSENSIDLVYTYKQAYIYEGDGVSLLDVILSIDQPVTMIEAAMILLAMDKL